MTVTVTVETDEHAGVADATTSIAADETSVEFPGVTVEVTGDEAFEVGASPNVNVWFASPVLHTA